MTPNRRPDAGFTLIETLVALAILAMSAVSLLGATEAHVARIGALETRASAQWASENYLAELTLGLSPAAEPLPINGISFILRETRSTTSDADLSRVDITAREKNDGREYGRLIGFVDTGAFGKGVGG